MKDRVVKVGLYYVGTKGTVRSTAKALGYCSSTVYVYLTGHQYLPRYRPELARRVREQLNHNRRVAHVRAWRASVEARRLRAQSRSKEDM